MFQEWIGRFCIVRGFGSGVHAGVVEAIDRSTDGRLLVKLAGGNVRLWRYHCIGNGRTLSQVATVGCDRSRSRIEAMGGTVLIPDCCELLECSEEAIAVLTPVWAP